MLGRRSNSSGQAKMKGYVMLGHFSATSAPSFTAGLSSLGAAPGTVRSWLPETVVKQMVLVPHGCVCISEKGKKELMEIPNTHVLYQRAKRSCVQICFPKRKGEGKLNKINYFGH